MVDIKSEEHVEKIVGVGLLKSFILSITNEQEMYLLWGIFPILLHAKHFFVNSILLASPFIEKKEGGKSTYFLLES